MLRWLRRLWRRTGKPGRVELGEVLADGKQLWDSTRGKDYKSYWTNVSATAQGAVLVTRGYEMPRAQEIESFSRLPGKLAQALNLGRHSVVLEVGCGTGVLAEILGPRVAAYHGADISANMLDHARKHLQGRSNFFWHELPECSLKQFDDNSFDAVIFEAVLVHLDKEDSYRYLLETFRVLKPGGKAFLQFCNLMHPEGFQKFLTAMEAYCDGKGQNLVCRSRFHTPEEVRFLCQKAGFVVDEEASQLGRPEHFGRLHPEEYVLVAIVTKP